MTTTGRSPGGPPVRRRAPFPALVLALALAAGIGAPVRGYPSQVHPTAVGPTGGFYVPNPLTLPPEKTLVSVHLEGYNEFSESTLDVEPTVALSPKVQVGIYDHLEMGIEKTVRLETTTGGDEAIYLNAKYRVPFESLNVALGIIVPFTPPDWTSSYMVVGWKSLWAGFGFNFGGRNFRELALNNFQNVGVARLGGYELRRRVIDGSDQFTGEPSTFFGLFGLNIELSDHVELVADYNGDRVSAGVRLPFHSFTVDLIYVSQRAADTLFSRETQNYNLGVTGRF